MKKDPCKKGGKRIRWEQASVESFLWGRISIQGIVSFLFHSLPFHPLAATMMETTNEASDKRAIKDKTVNVATARVMRVLLEAEIFAGRTTTASTSIAHCGDRNWGRE